MSVSEVIRELYHWPICPNCAAGLTEVDTEELEACSQCGFHLNPSDYEQDFINDEHCGCNTPATIPADDRRRVRDNEPIFDFTDS